MARKPIWRHIYDTLRAEIVSGSFSAGDKLPTEKQYSERFNVNRHTVRRALAELTRAGIVIVRRGSGAYVAEGVLDYKIGPRTHFNQNVEDLGRTPSHQLLHVETIPASDKVAEQLRLAAGDAVVLLENVNEADGTPICVSEQYLPAKRFPSFAEEFQAAGEIVGALKRYGVIDFMRAWTRVSAVAPSRMIAKKLRQPDNAPVLKAEALNLDMAGQPIEYGVNYFAGQRASLMIETPLNIAGGGMSAPEVRRPGGARARIG